MATSQKSILSKKSSLKPKKSSEKSKRTEERSPISGPPVFLVLAGEHSGDVLGCELLRELRKHDPDFTFFGIGGPKMIEEGLDSIEDMEELSVIGFSAILFKYKFLKKLMDRLVDEAIARSCTHAILIDYPGFNLRLAARLKELGIKVIFYVSPQLWAWNFSRIFKIKENVDLMLVLFPFEKKLYDDYGVRSVFVGHPIAQRIREKIRKEAPIPTLEEKPGSSFTITVMPGSRSGEIHRILDMLLETAAKIHEELESEKKHVRFLLPNINTKEEEFIRSKIATLEANHPGIRIEYIFDRSLRAMEASDLVLVTSGTATLEVVYFEKPMVILYKVSFLTYVISAILIRTPFIGLVNILSGRETVKELIQAECTPEEAKDEALAILKNKKYRNQMIDEIHSVKESLGEEHTSRNAAKAVISFLKEKPQV